MIVERLFLAVPRGCLQFVAMIFPDHTHLLFSLVRIDNLAKRRYSFEKETELMFLSSFFQVTPNPFPDITCLKRLVQLL